MYINMESRETTDAGISSKRKCWRNLGKAVSVQDDNSGQMTIQVGTLLNTNKDQLLV